MISNYLLWPIFYLKHLPISLSLTFPIYLSSLPSSLNGYLPPLHSSLNILPMIFIYLLLPTIYLNNLSMYLVFLLLCFAFPYLIPYPNIPPRTSFTCQFTLQSPHPCFSSLHIYLNVPIYPFLPITLLITFTFLTLSTHLFTYIQAAYPFHSRPYLFLPTATHALPILTLVYMFT